MLPDIDALLVDLDNISNRVQEGKGKVQYQVERKAALESRISKHTTTLAHNEKALTILHELEATWRVVYEDAFAGLGTQGLSAVFGKDMEVLLTSTVKRGTASLDVDLIKEGKKTKIKGGSGGSVAQVLVFLLREIITLSGRPAPRPLMALDEPFSMVSKEFRPALCAMIRDFSSRLGVQCLFASHEDELADVADSVVLIHGDGKGTPEVIERREIEQE